MSQLVDTKSNDKKISLLHFIVKTVDDKFPDVATFDSELKLMEKAATGEGLDSATGEGLDSATGEGLDSATGEGLDFATGEGLDSATGEGFDSDLKLMEKVATGEYQLAPDFC